MAPSWSAAETKALLSAWHEEAALPAPARRFTIRSSEQLDEMYMRFVALCGGHTPRTQVSMYMRRNALKHMWRIITKYDHQHKHVGDDTDDIGNDTRSSSTGWTTQDWFALREWEKQVWFIKADVKSYKLVDIDQHTFRAIDCIMRIATHQKEKEQRRGLQDRQHVEDAGSSLSIAAQEAGEGGEAIEAQHDKEMAEYLPDDSVAIDSDSGSSTESDEGVIAAVSAATSEVPALLAEFVPPPSRKKNREPEIAQSTDNGWHPIITKRQKLSRPILVAQKRILLPPVLNQSPAQKQRMARSKLVFLDEPPPTVRVPAVNAAKRSSSDDITVSPRISSNGCHATEQQLKSAVTQSEADQISTSDAGPAQLVEVSSKQKPDTTGTQLQSQVFDRLQSQKGHVRPFDDQQKRPEATIPTANLDAPTLGSTPSTIALARRVRKRWKQWDDPDHPELVDRLQQRIEKLKSIFCDVSAYQKVTRDERKELLEQLRLDEENKRLVSEETRRRVISIQHELNEWRLEKEEFKREWRRMRANH